MGKKILSTYSKAGQRFLPRIHTLLFDHFTPMLISFHVPLLLLGVGCRGMGAPVSASPVRSVRQPGRSISGLMSVIPW